MPASKHKPITSSPEGSTPQSSTPIAPDWEAFCGLGTLCGHSSSTLASRISGAMCWAPFPAENEARCKRNWTASGANRRSRKRWRETGHREPPSTVNAIGEAVRSLAEDEENTFTFFALTREDASTHADHQCDRKSRRAM